MNFKEFLLNESKQDIVNLGIPRVVADIFYEKFTKNSFRIAKWYADYNDYAVRDHGDNWWMRKHSSWTEVGLADFVKMYNASDNLEDYKKTYSGIYEKEPSIEEYELPEQKEWLKKRIEADLFEGAFFNFSLIKDIASGKLTNLAPYKSLEFSKAQDRYDKKNIFKDRKPLKVYENGWKWIDVGKSCNLVGNLMKNCGSSGLMSDDEDRTIIALFDKGNKPHVMVTYSPNQKRISGDEGAGSSAVKDKYSDYVLDLADFLNVELKSRTQISKSKLLSLKYYFKDRLKEIERLYTDPPYSEYFLIVLNNGKEYYSDGHSVVEKDSIDNLIKNKEAIKGYGISKENEILKSYKDAFNMHKQKAISEKGIKYEYVR